ncbi:MAG: hypothetical protein EAZ97_05490 [Bacteroidetes bacterium]|nr:MAG: hypothetical protein EAZ97_05490 [Bacteroidota bacterium]
MGYSNYKKLKTVTKTFGLDAEKIRLFPTVDLVNPSQWLLETLEKATYFPLTNEKVKSEKIVSPILSEVAEAYLDKITLFSGEDLPVDSDRDLSGECDFFFVLAPRKPYMENPIISLVEAKDEDMDYGIAQCAAQLYGAKLFNEMEGKKFPILYGCATNSHDWQFLRFENNVFYIDSRVYTDLREILGVWHHILDFYTKKS